jgi:hypothetical protein
MVILDSNGVPLIFGSPQYLRAHIDISTWLASESAIPLTLITYLQVTAL